MSKSGSFQTYVVWKKRFNKKFTEKKPSRKLLNDINWEIEKLCKQLDEQD